MLYVAVVGLMIMIVIGAVTLQKATNVWIGRKWELIAHRFILIGSELMTNKNRLFPYDLHFEGVRVNVKSGKVYRKKKGMYYNFRIHTDNSVNCDFFLFIGYKSIRDKMPTNIWFIPADLIIKDNVTISPNCTKRCKWKVYEMEIPVRPEKGAKHNESKLIILGAVNRSPENVEQYACSTGC